MLLRWNYLVQRPPVYPNGAVWKVIVGLRQWSAPRSRERCLELLHRSTSGRAFRNKFCKFLTRTFLLPNLFVCKKETVNFRQWTTCTHTTWSIATLRRRTSFSRRTTSASWATSGSSLTPKMYQFFANFLNMFLRFLKFYSNSFEADIFIYRMIFSIHWNIPQGNFLRIGTHWSWWNSPNRDFSLPMITIITPKFMK